MDTMPYPETADIETSSEGYATRFLGEVGAWFLKVQEEATLKMLEPFPKARILDVGGGHGQVTEALIRQGYSVTVLGSDERCKKRIQPFLDRGQCFFQTGNVIDLPFQDFAFDVVLSYRLISHVNQWQKLIQEFSRVAKKAVIFDYPTVCSFNSIVPLFFGFKKRLEGNTRTFTCFRESQLIKEFNIHGFIRGGRIPEFFFPMVLHRVLKRPQVSAWMEKIVRWPGLTSVFGSPVIIKFIREGKV